MSEIIGKLLTTVRKQVSIKSHGNSMLPLLYPRDVLYFKKTNFKRIKINDLVMVKKRKQIFTHRVIYINKNYLITKGDNNITSDGKIYKRQIIGKVYKVKRNGQFFNPENIYLFQSTHYFQEIVKIKKALEKEKINFVFLKGLPLHLFYEKSYPRRIYADCDVLVREKDYQKADLILKKHGFRKTETAYSKFHKLLKDKETELVYVKDIHGFPVVFDVHLEASFLMHQLGRLDALYPQDLIDQMTEQFLNEKKYIKIQGQYFPILSLVNLIIYLSLHIFHHNFRGVFKLEFLDKVMRKSLQIPPPARCSDLAKNRILFFQLQNFVYPVFLLLKKYYSTPLPQKFLRSAAPKRNIQEFIKENILKINIFDEEARIKAGINRFKNLFYLSPSSFLRKLLIVFNPQVIYSFSWTIIFLARRLLVSSSKSR